MVGLKSLVFLSVLAFATACLPILGKPKPECGCHKKEPVGPIGLPIRKHSWVSLRYLVLSIGDVVRVSKGILSDILNLDVAATLDDVLDLVISLSRAIGVIIDVLIPGIGGLLGRLVIGIVRIVICILGAPSGLLGGILGPKRSGICVADYGCKWGWKRYDGKWSNHRDMLKHYELDNVSVELDIIVKKCTKGRGIIALNSLSRLVYDHILILVNLTIRSYDSWCKDDLTTVYVSILVLITTIGNSCKPGLGPLIADELEGYCSTHWKSSGSKDITIYNSDIKKRSQSIRCWRWKGVIISEEAKKSSSSETSEYESSEESRTSESRSDNSSESSERKKSDSSKTESRDWSAESKKSDQSSNSSSDSQSKSDQSQNSCDSDSNSGRRKITTEEISASSKESKEASKKDSRDSSSVQTDQKQINLKEGTITDTRTLEQKSSSVQEEKSASSSEKQLNVKKTVVEGC